MSIRWGNIFLVLVLIFGFVLLMKFGDRLFDFPEFPLDKRFLAVWFWCAVIGIGIGLIVKMARRG